MRALGKSANGIDLSFDGGQMRVEISAALKTEFDKVRAEPR